MSIGKKYLFQVVEDKNGYEHVMACLVVWSGAAFDGISKPSGGNYKTKTKSDW